jgi:hypothetical protein
MAFLFVMENLSQAYLFFPFGPLISVRIVSRHPATLEYFSSIHTEQGCFPKRNVLCSLWGGAVLAKMKFHP